MDNLYTGYNGTRHRTKTNKTKKTHQRKLKRWATQTSYSYDKVQ